MDKVVHFEIPVDDSARAKEFYGSIFDWDLDEADMGGGVTYTTVGTVATDEKMLPKEPGAINGGLMKRTSDTPTPVITIQVDSIDDTLKIEQKIQDVEKELQSLSVQLGDLLGKESFYHVQVTLFEYQPGSRLDRSYTVPMRLFHAFLWGLAWWLTVTVALAVLAATTVSLRTLWPGPALSGTAGSGAAPAS